MTRIAVGGDDPVRRARRARPAGRGCRRLLAGASQAAVFFAAPLLGLAGRVADVLRAAGIAAAADRGARRRGRQVDRGRRAVLGPLGAAGFTRTDAVVGVGGGAVTDLAGFVAACWLRGVRVGAGADVAARHGRRGGRRQDRREHRRRQEPGRRVPPAGRRALRPDTLATLPPADLVAGLAEVVKCGFIADPAILDADRGRPGGGRDPSRARRRPRPHRTRRSRSRREWSPRICASRACARSSTTATRWATRSRSASATAGGTATRSRSGWSSRPSWAGSPAASTTRRPHRHRRVLTSLGLPVAVPGESAWPELRDAMRVDKKTRGSHAALRRARRAGETRHPGRPRRRHAARGLRGGRDLGRMIDPTRPTRPGARCGAGSGAVAALPPQGAERQHRAVDIAGRCRRKAMSDAQSSAGIMDASISRCASAVGSLNIGQCPVGSGSSVASRRPAKNGLPA